MRNRFSWELRHQNRRSEAQWPGPLAGVLQEISTEQNGVLPHRLTNMAASTKSHYFAQRKVLQVQNIKPWLTTRDNASSDKRLTPIKNDVYDFTDPLSESVTMIHSVIQSHSQLRVSVTQLSQ